MYPHILSKKPDHAVCLWCFVGSSPQSLECQRQSECVQNVMRFVPELSLLISHHFKDTKRSDRDLFLWTRLHLNRNTYGRIIHKNRNHFNSRKLRRVTGSAGSFSRRSDNLGHCSVICVSASQVLVQNPSNCLGNALMH